MGLVALHVAYQGDHPIFFYGSNYLGPLEGYAAAPLFHLFGTSLFALRLPLVLFFTGFLLSMYYLVRLLYSEKFALATVILLGLGTSDVFFLQLRACSQRSYACSRPGLHSLRTGLARSPVGRRDGNAL